MTEITCREWEIFLRVWISFHSFATKYVLQTETAISRVAVKGWVISEGVFNLVPSSKKRFKSLSLNFLLSQSICTLITNFLSWCYLIYFWVVTYVHWNVFQGNTWFFFLICKTVWNPTFFQVTVLKIFRLDATLFFRVTNTLKYCLEIYGQLFFKNLLMIGPNWKYLLRLLYL